MPNPATHAYRHVFSLPAYRLFWGGFTVSVLGDAMTTVALIWIVLQMTHSAVAIGWLLFCYTGPVIVGGFFAGYLLDTFDRRMTLLIDTIIRGIAMATIPLAYSLGHLALWQIYVVASIYGFFFMITLAGTPTLIPALVPSTSLAAANALETLSYTLSGIFGPALAGFLIIHVQAPTVLVIDVLSYGVFALTLILMRQQRPQEFTDEQKERVRATLRDAFQLVFSNRILRTTTLMFMLFNIGGGMLALWLPFFAEHLGNGGAQVYGLLLGAMAIGEALGAIIGGGVALPFSLGSRIAIAQIGAGLALALLLFRPTWWLATLVLVLYGACSAPLTIWAQTLRMHIIPDHLRGRTFALLRTLMQSVGPLASAGAGMLLPVTGVFLLMGASALFIGAPGIVGLQIAALRHAGSEQSRNASNEASAER